MIPAANYPLNCVHIGESSSNQVKKLPLSERRFSIIAEKLNRITNPQSTQSIELGDRNVSRVIGQSYVSDFRLSTLLKSRNLYDKDISFISNNPNICTIDSNTSIASHVSDGVCTVQAISIDGESSCIKLVFSSGGGGNSDSFTSWKTNSLAYHIQSYIDGMFADLTNSTTLVTVMDRGVSWFQTQMRVGSPIRYWQSWPGNSHLSNTGGVAGHQNINGPWIRDTNFWLYPIDFTGISQWTISTNNSFLVRGSLITPEHCISCAHGHEPNVGDVLLFITNNGNNQPETIYQRTVTAKQKVNGCDFSISRLSSPLPSEISYFKVLPKTWFNKMIGFNTSASIPIIRWNQDHHATVNKLVYPLTNYNGGTPIRLNFSTQFDVQNPYTNYCSRIRFLDSGNPNFLIVNDEAVLVSTHSTVMGGPLISQYYDEIELVLQSLGGATTSLTPADLSGFPSFSNPYLS